MAASRGWQSGRRRRRRVISGVVAIAVVGLLLFLVVQACGGENQGQNATTDSGQENGSNSSGETSGDGSGNEQTGQNQQPVEKPYRALAPSPDALSLSENVRPADSELAVGTENAGVAIEQYTAGGSGVAVGETTGATGMETTGASQSSGPSRSVPLGETLLMDKQDNSDGPLKENRIVAYYGTPASNLMGILGEYEPNEMMRLLKEQTQAYSDADPERPAIPAIEFIASVAQRDPGPEGLYVASADPAEIRRYSELARENGALLILDVQLGRATVMDEVKILEEFLKEPYVHLAIDTEYSIDEGEVPGVDLGSVDGAEIQEAVEYLDNMVEEEGIPDKIVMVHQFDLGIVTNKQAIEPTNNVEVVLHADGFGGPEAKFSKYGTLVRAQPIQYGAFKVFYTQDTPVLEPQQVLALDPAPAIITYQ